MKSIININGKKYEVEGNGDVSIKNGQVFVDGKPLNTPSAEKQINISIQGNVQNLQVDQGDVQVEGVVLGNVDCGGSFKGTSVGGYVDCGGSAQCTSVGGNVDAGGSVQCGEVKGSVDAGGSVKIIKP